MATATDDDLASQLRDAIEQYPGTIYELAKRSEIGAIAIHRFVAGERDLQLTNAGKVARVLGLKLVKADEPKASSKKLSRKNRQAVLDTLWDDVLRPIREILVNHGWDFSNKSWKNIADPTLSGDRDDGTQDIGSVIAGGVLAVEREGSDMQLRGCILRVILRDGKI